MLNSDAQHNLAPSGAELAQDVSEHLVDSAATYGAAVVLNRIFAVGDKLNELFDDAVLGALGALRDLEIRWSNRRV